GNCILGLAFSADEQEGFSLGSQVLDVPGRFLEHLQRLLKIDDVDAIALAENEFLHFGVPALGLVPEVDARFEQLLHGDISQSTSFVDLHPAHIEQDCYSRPRTCSSTGRIEHLSSFSAISYQLSAKS